MFYQHREAFCRMKYRDEAGNIEWIWNARDGVTPFTVTSLQGLRAQHTDFREDQRLPDYIPSLGERIFVDLTEERALTYARRNVKRGWDHPQYPMSENWASKEEAAQELAKGYLSHAGAPDLIEVTEGVIEWVKKQHRRNS